MRPVFPSLEQIAPLLRYHILPSVSLERKMEAMIAHPKRIDTDLLATYVAGFLIDHGYHPKDVCAIPDSASSYIARSINALHPTPEQHVDTKDTGNIVVEYKLLHATQLLHLIREGTLPKPDAYFPVVDFEFFDSSLGLYEREKIESEGIPCFPLVTNSDLVACAHMYARKIPHYPRVLHLAS